MKQFTMPFNMHYLVNFAMYLIAYYVYITPVVAQNINKYSIEIERKQIQQEKFEIESSYKEMKAICLKKFVATPCMDDANQQKKKALAKIKQRELVLNDEARELKKSKIKNKQPESPIVNSQSQSQSQIQEQIRFTDPQLNTEEHAKQKQLQTQEQAKLRVEKTEKKKVESAEKAGERLEKSKQESANSAQYQSKVVAAQARKNAIDEKNANRSKPKAAPLPLPISIPK